ncbi:hypothetical protein [Sorangium sp. So ce388]
MLTRDVETNEARDIDERAREHEERRQRRGETDVNYGAREDQVPAEGWVT